MKVPEPKQLPSGNWFIRLRLGGLETPVTKPTKQECYNTALLIKAEYRNGKRLTRCNKTLHQAIDDYIKSRDSVLSPSTIRGYRMIQKHRFQSLMNLPLSQITDKEWMKAVNAESKTYKAKTVKNSWLFICSVLKENDIAPPKVKLPQVIQKERPFLEPDDIPTFIAAVHGKQCEVPALLALHSLRLSEILGLRWEDIDIENKIIHVRGSAVRDENNKVVRKKENKNTSSRRDIPIFIPELINALVPNGNDVVVPMYGETIRTQINAVCRSVGLPEVGVHGLRHSFCSVCYFLSIPTKTVMKLGGWKDDKTMTKIYTHLAQKEMEKDIVSLSAFFQNGNENGNEIVNA